MLRKHSISRDKALYAFGGVMLTLAVEIVANLASDQIEERWGIVGDLIYADATPWLLLVAFFIAWAVVARLTRPQAAALPSASAPGISTAVFAPNRDERQYDRLVKNCGKRVRAVWNTGGGLERAHILEELFPHLESVILPEPDAATNPIIPQLARAQERKVPDKARSQFIEHEIVRAINGVSWAIQQYNESEERSSPTIELLHRRGYTGNLLTFTDEWVFIEIFIPGLAPKDRPSVLINKADYPDAYENLERAYQFIRADCREPESRLGIATDDR